MPRNPKLFIPNRPYLATSRTECGIYFTPSPFMNMIIEGILAKAVATHAVDLCDYYFGGNHFHMIAIPRDPLDFPLFFKYIKQETAHAINRLIGSSSSWRAGRSPVTGARYFFSWYTQISSIYKTGVFSWPSGS